MTEKVVQTISIYVLSIVLPVLVISATRKEHPLTLLHEIYTFVKNSAINSLRLAIRIVQKAPMPFFMNSLLERLGLLPNINTNTNTNNDQTQSEVVVINTEELDNEYTWRESNSLMGQSNSNTGTNQTSLSVRDEYADLLTCTIGMLRQGEDLSLAYRELTYIPTFFAHTPDGSY